MDSPSSRTRAIDGAHRMSNVFPCSLVPDAPWLPMDVGFRCTLVSDARWFPMHVGFRCTLVSDARWFPMHVGFRCSLVPDAPWLPMHVGFRCLVFLNVRRSSREAAKSISPARKGGEPPIHTIEPRRGGIVVCLDGPFIFSRSNRPNHSDQDMDGGVSGIAMDVSPLRGSIVCTAGSPPLRAGLMDFAASRLVASISPQMELPANGIPPKWNCPANGFTHHHEPVQLMELIGCLMFSHIRWFPTPLGSRWTLVPHARWFPMLVGFRCLVFLNVRRSSREAAKSISPARKGGEPPAHTIEPRRGGIAGPLKRGSPNHQSS
jgi:hypothetical protein